MTPKEKNEYKKLGNVTYFIPEQNRAEELTPKSVSYYIISSEIMKKSKTDFFEGEELNISPIGSLYFLEDKIIIKNKDIIKFGNFDSSFKLTLEYLFNYYTEEIANLESKYLKKLCFRNYIDERRVFFSFSSNILFIISLILCLILFILIIFSYSSLLNFSFINLFFSIYNLYLYNNTNYN